MRPIGPKVRNLNRDFAYREGTENQLAHWGRRGALAGAPDPAAAPRLAVWDDPKSGTLDARARAWLEINCAHCHNPDGPARNSGLDLLASQRNPTAFGINKPPVAAGIGSGGLAFDIVPGQPDKSILVYRIASTHPGIMMPELGKRLVHEEGVALIREWIAAMPRAMLETSGIRRGELNAIFLPRLARPDDLECSGAVAVGSEAEGFGVVVGIGSRPVPGVALLMALSSRFEVDRLGQVVEEPGLAALPQVFFGAEAAHGDAGHWLGRLDLPHELEPVAVGQLDVREQASRREPRPLSTAACAAAKQSAVTTWWPRLRSTVAR